MVQRIVEELSASYPGQIEEIAFITGDFGKEANEQLTAIASHFGARSRIYQQDKPLGVAHAIGCAAESLKGNVFIAFSDTLFKANFQFDLHEKGVIWVKQVSDPSSFGVVQTNGQDMITRFVEKSDVFVSDLAIVGLYYVSEGELLRDEIDRLISNNIRDRGEFQITSVLENLRSQGHSFRAAPIEEWLDCGNKGNIISTNRRMLEIKSGAESLIADDVVLDNATLVQPCYVGQGVCIRNSVVGPYVSVGPNSHIENTIVTDSVILGNSAVRNAMLHNSLVGTHAEFTGSFTALSLGDYSSITE